MTKKLRRTVEKSYGKNAHGSTLQETEEAAFLQMNTSESKAEFFDTKNIIKKVPKRGLHTH